MSGFGNALKVELLTLVSRSDITSSEAQLSMCEDRTYCPRTELNSNSTCCAEKLGKHTDFNDAPISPGLVSAIRHPETTTSRSLTTVQSTPSTGSTSTAAAGGDDSSGHKIALGIGLGVALPAFLLALLGFFTKVTKRRKASAREERYLVYDKYGNPA